MKISFSISTALLGLIAALLFAVPASGDVASAGGEAIGSQVNAASEDQPIGGEAEAQPTVPVAVPTAEVPRTPESPEPSDVPPEPVAVPDPDAVTRTTPESVEQDVSVPSPVRRVAADVPASVPGGDRALGVGPGPNGDHGIDLPAARGSAGEATSAVQHRFAELTESARQIPVGAAAPVIDKLASLADPALLPADLPGNVVPLGGGGASTAVSPPPIGGEISPEATVDTLGPQRAGSLSVLGVTASSPFLRALSVEGDTVEPKGDQASRPGHGRQALWPGARVPEPSLLTDGDGPHRHGPVPLDIPLPAPESPATAVSDSVGPSFVPIAALLALLALAAPAARRRLGRALDHHVPTPFVCALERPG